MPQESLRSVVYRSFVTCDDPRGVADDCKTTIRKSKKKEQKIKKKSASDEELHNLSHFQVMEVSRGAEKLNQAIGSLSNRPSIDTTSDLLRGALDLQDSLVMLGRLQEASKFISNSHQKFKEKVKEEKRPIDDLRNELRNDFYKPRMSVSGDCYDELREVIRESFARQNLLPKAVERDVISCDVVDLPSSSSSSSLVHSHSSCFPPYEKTKGSNLIAKLMGLEGVPILKERMPYDRRTPPLLDIDLPRPKKPQFMVGKEVARERRTLEEIIETMQFKEILERKSVDGYKLYSNASFMTRRNGGLSELSAADSSENPPIVIMRPLLGRVQVKPHDHHWLNGGEQIKSRKMGRKMREEFPPRLQLKKPTPSKQRLVDEGKNLEIARVRPVKKAVDSQDRVSKTRVIQSKPPVPQMQKKEDVVEKSEKKPKIATNARKVTDTKDAKPQTQRELIKLTTLQHSKTVRENNAPKSQIARRKVSGTGTGTGVGAEKRMKPTSLTPTVPKKNPRRGERNSRPSSDLVENRQCDGNFAISSDIIIDESSLVKITEAEQTAEEVTEAFYMCDDSRNAATSPSDASGLKTNDDCDHTEDRSCIPSFDSDQTKGCKSMTNTRFLLLSSVSFLNDIEEHFDTGVHDSSVSHSPPDSEVLHDSLLLDCAKEILERKSLYCRSTRNQWSRNLLRRQKHHLSIEQLVEEICDNIEDLQNYSRSCSDVVVADSIQPMLDRDLWWNEEVTGAWDSGWRKGYAMEAVDEVMHDVEELVLSEIVADVIIGIM